MMKLVLPISVATVLAIAAGALWLSLRPAPVDLSPAMINIDGANIGGQFELTSHSGERVTSGELIDGPTLIYFGYTYCPDICPLDVQVMVEAVDLLAERGITVKPVFITVDPERDTPEELAYYAEAMHPRMVALTGSLEEIQIAADAYKVFFQKVELPDSAAGYLMQHTGFIYLVTPERGITAMFRREFAPEQIADDIGRVLAAL